MIRPSIKTYGPDGSFGAVLYVEKEGFMPLFERVKLAKRYDIAIMSSKGMSVTAARELVDGICSDTAFRCWCCTISIRPGSSSKTRWRTTPGAISYGSAPNVIDLGLTTTTSAVCRLNPNNSNISDERLERGRSRSAPRSTSCAVSGSS